MVLYSIIPNRFAMRVKRIILFLVCAFLCLLHSYAQDISGVKAQLDAMFSGMEKDSVSTGFLWDTAVNLVEGEDFNGSALTDSNYVDLPRLYDMIISLNSASVGADTIPANRAIARIQEFSSSQNAIVGVLFKPYNYIVANALQDNLITYSNQVVSDKFINGIWQNPYGEAVLVGHAVGKDIVVNQPILFTLQNVDSLSTQSFTSIQFDAGDGNGFRNTGFGTPLNVTYTGTGYHETKLKLVVGGITYLSHSMVNVIPTPSNPQQHPCSNTNSSLYDSYEVDTTFLGKTYTAKITYLSTTTFDNPIIVAEGFDPWGIIGGNYIHEYSGWNDIDRITGKSVFDGFDVFYIDWYDYGADIRANALLLEKAIKWVNQHKTSGNANVVLGQSMGGLIARYCLCDMERRRIPHDTKMYISHDAPHRGVNISPGLQYAYWDIREILQPRKNLFTWARQKDFYDEIMRIGLSASVRQMLPVYVGPSGNYVNRQFDTEYKELWDTLNVWGFPKGYPGRPIDNVSIVNGGNSGSIYRLGDYIIHTQLTTSSVLICKLLLELLNVQSVITWLPGSFNLSLTYNVRPFIPGVSKVRSYELIYYKSFLWRNNVPFTLVDKEANGPSSALCFDNYSCSLYYLKDHFEINNDSLAGLGIPESILNSLNFELTSKDTISFVPTASALGFIGLFNQDFFDPSIVTPRSSIPFDSFILKSAPSYHTGFKLDEFNGFDDWFLKLLSEVHVPPVVFDGDTLRIAGPSSDFNWASSNNSVASLTDSIVHRVSDGLVEFTASYSQTGQAITKTRKSIVGYPSVALSSQTTITNEQIVRAEAPNDEIKSLITDAVNKGILLYRWGVKAGASPIVWRNNGTVSDTIHVTVPAPFDYVTVYMQWQHGNDCDTTSHEVQVYRVNTYYPNIDILKVNPQTGIEVREDPLHSFSSITSTYGHYCMTFCAVPSASLPAITSITIENQTFPVTGVHYLPFNGTTAVVYVFDILYNQSFQNIFFLDPDYMHFGAKEIDVQLNGSNGSIQTISIFCAKRIRIN